MTENEVMPIATSTSLATDLHDQDNLNTLNRSLARVSGFDGFHSPLEGLMAVRKVLSGYGLELPQVYRLPEPVGEEIFLIGQFGQKSGSDFDFEDEVLGMPAMGRMVPPQGADGETIKDKRAYFIYFIYSRNPKGLYDIFCSVMDEETLLNLMQDDNYDDYDMEDDDDLDPTEPMGESVDVIDPDSHDSVCRAHGWRHRGGIMKNTYRHMHHKDHEIDVYPNKYWEHISPDEEVLSFGKNAQSLHKHLEKFHKTK